MPRNPTWLICVASSLALAACSSSNEIRHMSDAKPANVSESKADKKEDAARVRVQLGQQYLQQGKLEYAMENLQKALEYDPNYVDAHTVIAVLYEHIGNQKAAEEHYARAAQLAPKSGDANNNYGQFLCTAGKYALAQQSFTAAMADPFYKTPDVLYTNAGSCLMKEGGSHLDDAALDFRKAARSKSEEWRRVVRAGERSLSKKRFLQSARICAALRGARQSRPGGTFARSKYRSETRPCRFGSRLRAAFARVVPGIGTGPRFGFDDFINF